MEQRLSIREIALSDAESAARLSVELGYGVSTAAMTERIRRLADTPHRTVFVACVGDSVVAWIDVGEVCHLQSDPAGEIGGFVVAEGFRSTGIGRELLRRAEQWARDRQLGRIVVRCQIKRDAAHRFYLREGFELAKTSHIFAKPLG
jgi:GNAT superfamily N-acetyltransferase